MSVHSLSFASGSTSSCVAGWGRRRRERWWIRAIRGQVRQALENPDAIFLAPVTNRHGGCVPCKPAAEETGGDHENRPIGTGPFRFE